MTETSRLRAEATLEPATAARAHRVFLVRLVNFLTNYVVGNLPIFALRHAWYRRVLGLQLGSHTGIHLGCYVWFYSPRQVRRDGTRIGANSRINRDCCLDVRGPLRI